MSLLNFFAISEKLLTWFNELKIIWSDILAISFSSSFLNAGEKVLISPPKYFLANFDSYKPEQHEPSKYSDIIGASEKVEKALRAIRIFTFVCFLSSYKISKLVCNAFLSITKHGLGNLFKSS